MANIDEKVTSFESKFVDVANFVHFLLMLLNRSFDPPYLRIFYFYLRVYVFDRLVAMSKTAKRRIFEELPLGQIKKKGKKVVISREKLHQ